ncbi:roadblock/LC7 domain-containing protein [Nocardiopsis salina]|uniref:roadblock/LC7 domain-containing protein n=1 Tax=Nocardiopsis salina TaxID=245836 RepID=UPI0003467DAF|nr:roadblock/LC7 domain-containing protein [Nocardiopsis salina]
MVGNSKAADNLDWLLDDLVDLVVGADHAIVLSSDGLLLGSSRSLGPEDAEHLAALASAFQSLARGTGRHFGGGEVRQTVVEMERSYLFVTAAGAGACLAVLAGEEADVGLVAYEMNLRVKQVGQFLTAAPRTPGHLTTAGGGPGA